MRPRLVGGIDERTNRRSGRDASRVGLGEAQGTIGVHIDLLAAGDLDILILLVGVEIPGKWFGFTMEAPPGVKMV